MLQKIGEEDILLQIICGIPEEEAETKQKEVPRRSRVRTTTTTTNGRGGDDQRTPFQQQEIEAKKGKRRSKRRNGGHQKYWLKDHYNVLTKNQFSCSVHRLSVAPTAEASEERQNTSTSSRSTSTTNNNKKRTQTDEKFMKRRPQMNTRGLKTF